jgi:hypothetical protein
MKLTIGKFRDGSLALSCKDNGAKVLLVFASGEMRGDPQRDDLPAILDAIETQVEHEAMRAERDALRAEVEQLHKYLRDICNAIDGERCPSPTEWALMQQLARMGKAAIDAARKETP